MLSRNKMLGCLLGGAIGDALGAPIEFMSLSEIQQKYGKGMIQDLETGSWGRGAVTDDTQMMLFTLEGLIRGYMRYFDRGFADLCTVLHHAYQRWLVTQGVKTDLDLPRYVFSGWLLENRELYNSRAPGNTCITALINATGPGRHDNRLNNSKGCGGIMRVAPVGLMMLDAFSEGVTSAAITHCHPTGYLAAGYFAELIKLLAKEELGLREAAEESLKPLQKWDVKDRFEVVEAVLAAFRLAEQGCPTAEKIEQLGEGWVAEEALSIALYCALVAKDFRHGVLLAINHGGDSDSTGMLAGNLLGAIHGLDGIPKEWQKQVEFGDLISEMVDDALVVLNEDHEDKTLIRLNQKYPPN